MRISRLRIKNFRSVQALDIVLPDVCALVGPNNSGKSNILEALRRVLGGAWLSVNSFNENDIYRRDSDRDVEICCTVTPPIAHVEYKGADPVEVHSLQFQYTKYKIGEKKGDPRLEQKCLDARDQPIKVLAKAPKKGQQREYKALVGVPSDIRDGVPLIYIGTNRSLTEQLPSARYSLLRQMFQEIDKDLNRPEHTVKVKRLDGSEEEVARIDRFREVMGEAMQLLRTEDFIKLETAIKRNALRQLGFDPETDTEKLDLAFAPLETLDFYKSLELWVNEQGFSISASEMGEGVQNAIVLAILKAFEETRKSGAILLIEEPEMFLHPQMQRSLYKTLREIGNTNQVIYTTHSPHFVSVPEYNRVMLVRKGEEGTNGQLSTLAADPKRHEKLIKELDPERGELFFAHRVLIVEGDTEKLALPVYAARKNVDLDLSGATIIEVGGKRNLMDFAEVAISFGIPTGVIYDRDSSDFKNKEEEEKAYNAKLNGLAKADGSVRVWMLDKDYEDHLRRSFGDNRYQEICQKYPNMGKPTRARLIALESSLPVPDLIEEVIAWLVAS